MLLASRNIIEEGTSKVYKEGRKERSAQHHHAALFRVCKVNSLCFHDTCYGVAVADTSTCRRSAELAAPIFEQLPHSSKLSAFMGCLYTAVPAFA